ncbi:MAG: AcrR family transcriptional regulator [Cocleimonas sp.]|jgi:AcrR family transcriptional regulator
MTVVSKLGRKRSFNKEEALEKAMFLFWENGYLGTSITELTQTLGINKPSLYSAFGNKEQLFKSSLDYYMKVYGNPHLDKLSFPEELPFKDRLSNFMTSIAESVTDSTLPKGCLFVKTTCEGSEMIPEHITSAVQGIVENNNQVLLKVLRDEQEKGEIPQTINVIEYADFIDTMLMGMGVQAKNGASIVSLQAIIQLTVAAIVK